MKVYLVIAHDEYADDGYDILGVGTDREWAVAIRNNYIEKEHDRQFVDIVEMEANHYYNYNEREEAEENAEYYEL